MTLEEYEGKELGTRMLIERPPHLKMMIYSLDVLDGMKEMFTRTQFAVDQGGYFPEIKVG